MILAKEDIRTATSLSDAAQKAVESAKKGQE
jgi:hypothetical protein